LGPGRLRTSSSTKIRLDSALVARGFFGPEKRAVREPRFGPKTRFFVATNKPPEWSKLFRFFENRRFDPDFRGTPAPGPVPDPPGPSVGLGRNTGPSERVPEDPRSRCGPTDGPDFGPNFQKSQNVRFQGRDPPTNVRADAGLSWGILARVGPRRRKRAVRGPEPPRKTPPGRGSAASPIRGGVPKILLV
jgi:hypothetical protein